MHWGFALAVLLAAAAARAKTLKVAVGQKGVWDTSVTVWGEHAGFFGQEGLDLDILCTDGGAQTQQALMSGGAQIGIGTGTLGVLSAAVRGAPVRVIEAEWHGASDLFWHVKAGSPIQTMKDAAGRTAGYSGAGSSSNLVQPDVMKGLAATLHDMLEQKRVPPSTTVDQLMPAIDLLAGP